MSSSMLAVRLKPYNPPHGHKLQRLTVSAVNGKLYEEGKWYEEEKATARQLAEVNQDGSISKLRRHGMERAFDVMTFEEKEELEAEALRLRAGVTKEMFIAPDRSSKEERARPTAATRARVGARVGARKAV